MRVPWAQMNRALRCASANPAIVCRRGGRLHSLFIYIQYNQTNYISSAPIGNRLNVKKGFRKPYTLFQHSVLSSSQSHFHSPSPRAPLVFDTKFIRHQRLFSISNRYKMNNNINNGETSGKYEFLKQEPMCTGKWLSLNKTTYRDQRGKERTWETVERTTRGENIKVDAVCMIAVLKRVLHYDCMVLVKQYRPAMKCYTVEFPAGLIDPNENIEEASLRELKEETGYTATVTHKGTVSALDPGVSNCNVVQVSLQIDGDDPVNEKPRQNKDDCESIEVLLLPIRGLIYQLQDLAEDGKVVIDSRVYAYALGLHQSKEFFNTKKM
ncbi:ADP-sugar pyrophosphatase-like [Ptychodera flava]|uniref:ADP-sugar pyrophosphatase-like n=1 Tax=Ptychodera flava TaxID=63121 RepID=UPI00396A7CED